jgi:hypothetical protein
MFNETSQKWEGTCELVDCPENADGAPQCECQSGYEGDLNFTEYRVWDGNCTLLDCPKGADGAPNCTCNSTAGYDGFLFFYKGYWLGWCSQSGGYEPVCPPNSTGASVAAGCVCNPGFAGSVTPAFEDPFYYSNCSFIQAVFIAGGTNISLSPATSAVYMFDLASYSWKSLANMQTARAGLSITVLEGFLYAIGGRGNASDSSVIAYVEKLNYALDGAQWTNVSKMLTSRVYFASAICSGSILVFGGWSGTEALGSVEMYRTLVDGWIQLAEMREPRFAMSAITYFDSVYIIGGTAAVNNTLRSVEIYHMVNATQWGSRNTTSLPTAKQGIQAVLINGSVLAIAGGTAHNAISNGGLVLLTQPSNETFIYDTRTLRWTAGANMTASRQRFGAWSWNGTVYAAGGVGIEGIALGWVDRYTAATGWGGDDLFAWLPNSAQSSGLVDFGCVTVIL